jgi:hypothetical protein
MFSKFEGFRVNPEQNPEHNPGSGHKRKAVSLEASYRLIAELPLAGFFLVNMN